MAADGGLAEHERQQEERLAAHEARFVRIHKTEIPVETGDDGAEEKSKPKPKSRARAKTKK